MNDMRSSVPGLTEKTPNTDAFRSERDERQNMSKPSRSEARLSALPSQPLAFVIMR